LSGCPCGPALIDIADQIRPNELERGSVAVEVSGDRGTVTLTGGNREATVPVEDMDRDWLIADARPVLFGSGR
jgi:hypothetical protein